MFPHKRKISTRMFPFVLKKGKTVFSEHFSFKFVLVPNAKESRFSFVVSGKVSKKAVERNLLKRRGYAIIKKTPVVKTMPTAGVFFAKSGATKLSYRALEREIGTILARAQMV